MLASVHNVFDMRMEYKLPFITGKMYALIYVGNETTVFIPVQDSHRC